MQNLYVDVTENISFLFCYKMKHI